MFTDCFDISKNIILPCSVVTCLAIFIAVTAYVLHSTDSLVSALFMEGITEREDLNV